MAEELWHHGIKGQKWGIRHTPEQLGHGGVKTSKKEVHEDYKKAHDSKNVKTMSDAELRSRLNRLNMEKQYSQMNPNSVQRGRAILKSTMGVIGTVAVASSTAITLKKNYETIRDWLPSANDAADVGRNVRNIIRSLK